LIQHAADVAGDLQDRVLTVLDQEGERAASTKLAKRGRLAQRLIDGEVAIVAQQAGSAGGVWATRSP